MPENPAVESRMSGRTKAIAVSVGLLAVVLVPVICLYLHFSHIVNDKLRNGAFGNTSNIYAAPELISTGDKVAPGDVIAYLRKCGYSDSGPTPIGQYKWDGRSLEIHPGDRSFFAQEPATISFSGSQVSSIVSGNTNSRIQGYRLEPELITNMVDDDREKRQLVRFNQIPATLVQAVVSTEDKHFFHHLGFDPFRIAKAALVDLKSGRKDQGASTLSMQLARGLWLEPEKLWKRKLNELAITLVLEQKLNKRQIFEAYANQVYLGRQSTYSIHGFGEAAHSYFGKDIGQLTLPESALLAGMVQRPSYFNPYRYPERALARRNSVLTLMQQNGYITPSQYEEALKAPVGVVKGKLDAGDAPYFIALMNDELQSRLPENQPDGIAHAVYTTLDLDLQRAALDAVRIGMENVDKQIKARWRKRDTDHTLPQVALVALDPHTGEIKAVVGGRDYAVSQLNHAISKRQPGSVFKPFVYAAALNTGVAGDPHPFTPSSTVIDEPTTFRFGNQIYQPSNFDNEFFGRVTLVKALAKSLNVATVSVAEKVGYGKIAALAKRAGINENVQPTPAMALGAYEATPLEIGGAYTIFANQGEYVKPTFLSRVSASDGRTVLTSSADTRRVLDPRVSYLMLTMLQEVLRSGTAAGVRSRGFTLDAAGKTGTSRDGWFAGFTSGLLCVVWVGFDDNRELNLEGAKSALPIWTEFMKRAVQHGGYSMPFAGPPAGVVKVAIDLDSGLRAGPDCHNIRTEYFIDGTQPKAMCSHVEDPFAEGLGSMPFAGFSVPGVSVPLKPQ